MSDPIISVRDLSKRYVLGKKRAKNEGLRHAIEDAVKAPLKMFKGKSAAGNDPTEFWAVNGLNFDVYPGQVMGVVGRNGAGKSTLLKLLSRITEPTEGSITLRGRIASLLEVGTGFHPELSGRENIFLNGAILGMSRREIQAKFDEIVAFAEVERFLDTPVKRYSSGMYVRLAFSVAAHLEPEILIVDEVLAVGDAEFQKKCIGKMEGVASQEGRTVIVVSHQMPVIQSLCQRCILMEKGKLTMDGTTEEVLRHYSSQAKRLSEKPVGERTDRAGSGEAHVEVIGFYDADGRALNECMSGQGLRAKVRYSVKKGRQLWNCRIHLGWKRDNVEAMVLSTELTSTRALTLEGSGEICFDIPRLTLPRGTYHVESVITQDHNAVLVDWVEDASAFNVVDGDFYGTGRIYDPGWEGATSFIEHSWSQKSQAVAVAVP